MPQTPMVDHPDHEAGRSPSATSPLLSVRGLKTYFKLDEGIVRAVDGVSFDLFAGRTLGIVGESGCGKSISARSILGIVDRPGKIEGGEIWLQQEREDSPAIDLLQLPYEGAEMRAIRGKEIAALACDPRILIADEPTTALDVTTQAQVLNLLQRIQKERGLSVILITHDMGVVAEMADDVVVMYLGRAVEKGPVDEIFHDPKHPYTQALLRSIPSIMAKPRTKLATIEGSIPHPFARPSGCPFHPRCPDAIKGLCDVTEPPTHALRPDRAVSCFLYGDAS